MEDIFRQFGLNKSKAAVYIATLKLGRGTAVDIGKQAGLPRTTTHEILSTLSELGLVSFTVKGRARIYLAENPAKLKKILAEKQRQLEASLPELMSLYNTAGTRPRVRFYEGSEGVKTVFEDTLTVSNKILHAVLSMKDLLEFPGEHFVERYTKKRIDAGIRLKVMRSESKEIKAIWRSSKKDMRELRYLPKEQIFPMTLYMYDKKVALMSTKQEKFGMIIESADFYSTMKNFFDIVWEVSKITKNL